MKNTNILQKIFPSIINIIIVFILSFPIYYFLSITIWKISVIVLFFLYNLFFLIFYKNVCLGMMLCRTKWKEKINFQNELLYIVLYTLSFSTLFIWIWFPFDVFLINILLLQLPCVLITGTTLHGYLSGKDSSIVI